MSNPRGSEAYAHTVNGPTDLAPDELAERKRLAAVDYHTAELAKLNAAAAALKKRGADKDKLANQKQMIADEEAALAAAKGA